MRRGASSRRPAPATIESWIGRHIVICNWRDSSHPNTGGAETYCERIAQRFSALGAEVTLLTSRPPSSPSVSAAPFGTIRRMGSQFTLYPLALAWLALHRRRIDAVIDSQNGIPFFSPLALRRHTPSALLIHHVHQDQFGLYFPRWLTTVGCFLENQASAWVYGRRPICVVSPSSRSEVRRRLSFDGPLYVTPCGQDVAYDEHDTARDPRPTVIYVGRFVRQKRIELLIEAFVGVLTEIPDARLLLVGDGEERAQFEMLVAERGLGGAIEIVGRVSDDERDELLRRSWLFVSTSVAEGWGMSIMEAAANGTPAVSFRVPGLQDAIEEGSTGWLVDPDGDVGAQITAALRDLADPEIAAEWATRCTARARRFAWSATADRLLGVLESERERLVHPFRDRRAVSDSATLVTVPRALFSATQLEHLRRQDQARFGSSSVEILLVGADEAGALAALERINFPLERVERVRVAASSDLIGWEIDSASARLGSLEPPSDDLQEMRVERARSRQREWLTEVARTAGARSDRSAS